MRFPPGTRVQATAAYCATLKRGNGPYVGQVVGKRRKDNCAMVRWDKYKTPQVIAEAFLEIERDRSTRP